MISIDAHSSQAARIIFAGTPEFAAVHLRALLAAGIRPVAVYTQPDRPAGRGQQLQKSAVKLVAEAAGIAVEQPVSLRDENAQKILADYQAELMLVVAYGLILPASVLAMPRLGCVNVHASLLPRWRGAAPIQRALQHGDSETGTALMQMEAGLDTGPILAEIRTTIAATDTGASLHDRLAQMGAQLLVKQLPDLLNAKLTPQVQSETGISYAHKLTKAEAKIDWSQPAAVIERNIRAFDPFPVSFGLHQNENIKIFTAQLVPLTGAQQKLPAGSICAHEESALVVRCGDQNESLGLALTSVQLPGGKRLSVRELLHARRERFAIGSCFQ